MTSASAAAVTSSSFQQVLNFNRSCVVEVYVVSFLPEETLDGTRNFQETDSYLPRIRLSVQFRLLLPDPSCRQPARRERIVCSRADVVPCVGSVRHAST